MGAREHAPDTRRQLEAGGRIQVPELRERNAQAVPRRVSDVVEDFTTPMAGRTKRSTAAADLDYKTAILAAQILVERPEDRIYDDIAAAGNALRDELEVDCAQFIEAA
jgi:hypothetical protein